MKPTRYLAVLFFAGVSAAVLYLSLRRHSASQYPKKIFPAAKSDLPTNLTYLCQRKKAPCVIDFTASAQCGYSGADLPGSSGAMAANLERFVSACGMYGWKQDGNIYIVKPKQEADSALNVQVGPVQERLTSSELISELCTSAHLIWFTPDDLGLRGDDSKSRPQKEAPQKVIYHLTRAPLRDSLIQAAKQSGHSYWLVNRQPDNKSLKYTGPIFGCRANDLDSTARYVRRTRAQTDE
jgi:hypothetical protein